VVLWSFGDRVEIVTVSVPLSLRHLVASNLRRYKASYLCCFHHLCWFLPTAVKIGPPTCLSLSFGIRFQVFTVGSITISFISYLCFLFTILCSLFRTHSPRKKSQKETKPLFSIAGLVSFMSFVVAHHTLLHIVTFVSTWCCVLKKRRKKK
jgi:hypothetical protein